MFALQFLPPIFILFPFLLLLLLFAAVAVATVAIVVAPFLHIKYVQTFSINICVKIYKV